MFAMLVKLAISIILFQSIVSYCNTCRWLLGYPVTYLFRNGSAEAATKNLSKHSLHIYRIYVVRFGFSPRIIDVLGEEFLVALILVISYCRSPRSDAKQSEEELLR